ncbi:hypothetical protein I7I50_06262 [Histoplasma capsulatum G186AR]|uniref:Uncharacterized protein n=1 Tax=Ajellomyces capsulatus TaxID=5037 RepID=A0A8H7YZN5_AJECA|nr:hypothetical protein I7I52_10665 [Histoplasma capsulatum]QSS67245.1 hypothetical protein I7I50_06262 [Histoplasma capsulatum G186AR]
MKNMKPTSMLLFFWQPDHRRAVSIRLIPLIDPVNKPPDMLRYLFNLILRRGNWFSHYLPNRYHPRPHLARKLFILAVVPLVRHAAIPNLPTAIHNPHTQYRC